MTDTPDAKAVLETTLAYECDEDAGYMEQQLVKDVNRLREALTSELARREEAEDALRRIANWSDAYPLSAFPEPDFKKARYVAKKRGAKS